MEKTELTVADIHAAAQPSEAFSLILKEKEGERYVPVKRNQDQIANVRWIIEKPEHFQKKIYSSFI